MGSHFFCLCWHHSQVYINTVKNVSCNNYSSYSYWPMEDPFIVHLECKCLPVFCSKISLTVRFMKFQFGPNESDQLYIFQCQMSVFVFLYFIYLILLFIQLERKNIYVVCGNQFMSLRFFYDHNKPLQITKSKPNMTVGWQYGQTSLKIRLIHTLQNEAYSSIGVHVGVACHHVEFVVEEAFTPLAVVALG